MLCMSRKGIALQLRIRPPQYLPDLNAIINQLDRNKVLDIDYNSANSLVERGAGMPKYFRHAYYCYFLFMLCESIYSIRNIIVIATAMRCYLLIAPATPFFTQNLNIKW